MNWRLRLPVALVCCLVVVCASTASSETPSKDISVVLDQDYVSKYVWRGLVANDDPAYQPSVTITGSNGLGFNIWGSMDTTGISGNSGNFTEIDYTLDYSFEAGGLPLNVGIISYTFPNTPFAGTNELYAGAALDGPMAPTAKLYYDFDEVDGFYLSIGCSHVVEKRFRSGKIGNPAFCASVGMASSNFNAAYFGVSDAALADLTLQASLPISAGLWTITPSLNYSTLLSGKLRDAVSDPDNFYAGIRATYSF